MTTTPLGRKLVAHIRETGPITIADFMTMCLADPEHGYYMRREPFGRLGDFITAPEISQMFGELIGLWAVAVWEMMGGPRRFVLSELGPGRGTLMADVIRTARLKPDFVRGADIHLVEMSPRLREIQRDALLPTGRPIQWHAAVSDLPPGPAIIIANEFFDALPIRQFLWRDNAWAERMVGISGDGKLEFGLAPVDQRPAGVPLPNGAIIETSQAGKAVMTMIAERLKKEGGAALVIDYGSGEPGTGDTLQAVRAHKRDDPLAAPGEADVTAHVDFAALARAAKTAGADVRALMGQGEFLIKLGLVDRANVLGRGKDEKTRDAIASAMHRLAAPKAMGTLFKVLAISSPGLKLPLFDPIEISQR